MQNKAELLPCPFCGGTDLEIRPEVSEDDSTHVCTFHVFCQDCHARGRNNYPIGWCETVQQAIEAWNDRFVPATIHGEDDRLMITTTAMLHIRGELDRIVGMTNHIHSLLTPIQMTRKRK